MNCQTATFEDEEKSAMLALNIKCGQDSVLFHLPLKNLGKHNKHAQQSSAQHESYDKNPKTP